MSDAVSHPTHYNAGKIEVIEFIEDQGIGEGFCLGNAIKYIARAGKKDASKTIEDLKKARWYLSRQIERLEAAAEGRAVMRPNDMYPRPTVVSGVPDPAADLMTVWVNIYPDGSMFVHHKKANAEHALHEGQGITKKFREVREDV